MLSKPTRIPTLVIISHMIATINLNYWLLLHEFIDSRQFEQIFMYNYKIKIEDWFFSYSYKA